MNTIREPRVSQRRSVALRRSSLAVQLFAFLFKDQHRVELIRANVIEAEMYAQLERGPEV